MDAWADIKFFKPSEFDSPDLPGSGSKMNIELVKVLDRMRLKCGFVFPINSGYRTPEHNKAIGGRPESEHTKGLAADIGVKDSRERYWVIKTALENGIKRIEDAPTWIHIGFSMDLDQEVLFRK